ncbi:MAG TPA: DnaJ domain-containing protein [Pyrinomonadaceae bacterium]|nr:DnaJ domain-containing protein [Pyrinomonadaceae bacterium]
MNGQLSEQPFAELIREISAKRMSGRLRVQQNRLAVVTYFKDGVFLYAAANVRTLRLRDYLTKLKTVDDSQLQQIGENRSDLQLAAALVEKNLIDSKTAQDVQLKQVADVLRVGLMWTEGTWEFNHRSHLNETLDFNLDPWPLLLETGRRLPSTFLASRFRNETELITLNQSMIKVKGLDTKETFILSQLERPRRLNELVAVSGFSSEETLRAIYALALSGVVIRESWKNAFREVAPSSYDVTKPLEVIREIEQESPSADASDLPNFLERVEAASTHYDVLAISSEASADEVKRIYYDFARRYHPDRFRRDEDTALHGRIETAFARVTRAYETLRNSSSRATYDSKLAAGITPRTGPAGKANLPSEDSVPARERAETYFREGLTALKGSQSTIAINNFALAAQLFPDQARYRAFYGHALSSNEKSRRLAEVELQAALKLEPDNPDYRTMLAQLYKALGFPRRARAEAERALATAPNHAGAHDLLKDLSES